MSAIGHCSHRDYTSNSVSTIVYVVSESNGQYFFHDGNRRIPIVPEKPLHQPILIKKECPSEDSKTNGNGVQEPGLSPEGGDEGDKGEGNKQEHTGATTAPPEFLSSESMSLSPSRLLHDAEGWLDAAEHDFSLTSFLGHLEGRPNVDSHLQSLMAESSVDYVAKFADLAAEVTDEPDQASEEPT